MATYIPGVQDFVPQLEAFTPDYKFLSDVLETRQDRYTTNYDHLNDVYGKVVYADLSRGDSQNKRDQYANQLSSRLHQITGLDLSLQQNVDAARGLFKPFYDDDLIVKDMIYTKQYRDQLQRAKDFQDSPVDKVREKYWDVGVEALNYQMEDFVNAPPEEALKMGSPKYVPDADLYERAINALKETGMSLKGTTFEGDWIVEQENGTLIVKQAREFIEEALLDDPIVKNAYWTKAYVEARKYGDQHAEEFGSADEAKKSWAEGVLEDYHAKQKAALAKTNTELEGKAASTADWEKYEEEYGIFEGSDEDKEYLKQLIELDILKVVKDKRKNRLAVQAAPAKDLTDLLSKAYAAVMAEDIGIDMNRAAVAFSSIDASVTAKANPFKLADYKMAQAHEYSKEMEIIKQRNKEQEMLDKFGYDVELEKVKATLKGFKGLNLGGNDPIVLEDLRGTSESILMEGTDIPDVLTMNDQGLLEYAGSIDAGKFQAIESVGIKMKGENTITYTHTNTNGEKEERTKSWVDARKDLLEENNSSELNRLFREAQKNMEGAQVDRPTWIEKDDYTKTKDGIDYIDKLEVQLLDKVEKMDESYDRLQNQFVSTEGGAGWGRNYKKGMPSIFMSDAWREGMYKEGKYATNRHTDGRTTDEAYNTFLEDQRAGRPVRGPRTGEDLENVVQKKLIGEEEYIGHYMRWAQVAKSAYNSLNMENSEVPYWTFDAPPDVKSRGEAGITEEVKQMANMRRMGQSMNVPGTSLSTGGYSFEWEFDEEKARSDAKRAYDVQRKAYNTFMNADPGAEATEGEPLGYSIKQAMAGETQTGEGVTKHKGYKFVYGHAEQDPGAVAQIEFLYDAINGVREQRVLRFGDEAADMKGTADQPKAKQVMDILQTDLNLSFGENDDKAGAPNFSITYAQSLGGKGAENKYAGYLIKFTPEYVKKLKSTRETPSNTFIDLGEWSTNAITVFVDKGYDNNPYNMDNVKPSVVKLQVVNNGELTFDLWPGGGAKMFQNSSGQLMVQKWAYGYDNNPKSARFGRHIKEMQPPQALTVRGTEIDGFWTLIQQQAENMRQTGLSRENLAKKAYPDLLTRSKLNEAIPAREYAAQNAERIEPQLVK
tara:strand:- start:59869 stop:63198 length:3330 start_codon:yes stop_codon:yes gene_type:complete